MDENTETQHEGDEPPSEAVMNPNTIGLQLMRATALRDDDDMLRLLDTIPLGAEVVQVITILAELAVGTLQREHPGTDIARVLDLAIIDSAMEALATDDDTEPVEGEDG